MSSAPSSFPSASAAAVASVRPQPSAPLPVPAPLVVSQQYPSTQLPPISSSAMQQPQHPQVLPAPATNLKPAPSYSTTTAARPPPPATVARASSTGQKRALKQNQQHLSEKKLRRLEKNRLSARECRRRKREATENLQREINVLEGENLRLRLQLRIGEEAEEDLGKEQAKVTEEIDKLLQSGASEGEVYARIEEFKEKFADYGRDRRSAIDYHLTHIERLLMPTTTTSVAMRALHGGSAQSAKSIPETAATGDAANTADLETKVPASVAPVAERAQTSTDITSGNDNDNSNQPLDSSEMSEPKKLFQYLVNFLEVTPEQAAALKDSRRVAHDLDSSMESSLKVLKELRTRLAQIGDSLETEFNNVRSILTPTQAAKFLVWVAKNRACMHMLNELWNRVYTEGAEGTNTEGDNSGDSDGAKTEK